MTNNNQNPNFKIKVKNIFAAVFEKTVLDPLLEVFDPKGVRFWGTEGTVRYLVKSGFSAHSVVTGFDFDGRVKSLDRLIFGRILADRIKRKHLAELRKLASLTFEVRSGRQLENTSKVEAFGPFDLVVVDLYAPDAKNFPESMDIGGQALIRAAVKNYKNVAVAFDKKSIEDVASQIKKNEGATTLAFRARQAKAALKFIAERAELEVMNYEQRSSLLGGD